MRKIVLVLAVVCATAPALAGLSVGDTIRFYDREGTTGGGEFGAALAGAVPNPELFRTFCVQLILAEEWLAQSAFDQAAAQLDAAARVAPETLADHVVDPSDWILARFTPVAKLAQLEGAGADGVRLPQETLEQLKDRHQCLEAWPTAVELLAAGGLPAEARAQLDAFMAGVFGACGRAGATATAGG
jgi:hypothetical protein